MTRALALSGGGAKGAFQVGALRALAARGISFDLFTGVSVGALNAALAARGKLDDLEAFWNTATMLWLDDWLSSTPMGYPYGLGRSRT